MSDPLPEAPVWVTREMECDMCDHQWVAVFPRFTSYLECPSCHYDENATGNAPQSDPDFPWEVL